MACSTSEDLPPVDIQQDAGDARRPFSNAVPVSTQVAPAAGQRSGKQPPSASQQVPARRLPAPQLQAQPRPPPLPKSASYRTYMTAVSEGVGEMMRNGVERRGALLVFEYTLAMLSSAGLALLCFWGFLSTDKICESRPVMLKTWFLLMAIMTSFAGVLFFVGRWSLVSLLVQQSKGREARQLTAGGSNNAVEEPAEEIPSDSLSYHTLAWTSALILCSVLTCMMWSLIGLIDAIDPREADYHSCKPSRIAIMLLSVTVFVHACFCQCCSVSDLHRLQTSKKSSEEPKPPTGEEA